LLIPVQTLVEIEGPEIFNSFDDKGHTAAHYACLGGHNTILRFIIDSRGFFDEPSRDEVGQRPMHWACINGHIGIVDLLLQVRSDGCSVLLD
jgi:palmitoyltransferase ZDHHC13/17